PDAITAAEPAVARSLPEPPLVEEYLYTGELARGEQALLVALQKNPADDQVRFGLGVLQFVRAIERFSQALHEYGARADNTNVPFLRVPVPKNDKPSTISYKALGRVFDVLIADLARAEKTLAGVKNEKVKLRLRLAAVQLDLTGDGRPTDKFIDILIKLNGGRFEFLKENPDFLVCFDRGDLAWLRAYCHLLSAMLEGYRALDLEAEFDQRVKDVFPKVELTGKPGGVHGDVLVIADGARLGRFRTHLLAVCELNRETWKFIRAETDDDHEWLPHPMQKGVIGLPVTDGMIDGWLAMVDQLDGLLEGELLLPGWVVRLVAKTPDGKGLNLKTLLDDPPASLSGNKLREDGIDAKYLEAEGTEKVFDLVGLSAVWRLFDGPLRVAYMAWFN
ncbi:MAG: hypothetical protein ACYTG0_41245, partial [Planctomycetota bacterium]